MTAPDDRARAPWRIGTIAADAAAAQDIPLPPEAVTLIVVNPLQVSALVSFGLAQPAAATAFEYELPIPPRSIVTMPILTESNQHLAQRSLQVGISVATGDSGDDDLWIDAFHVVSLYVTDRLMTPRVDRFLGSDSIAQDYAVSTAAVDNTVTTLMAAAGAGETVRGVFLQNLGPEDVYLGDSTVVVAGGLRLAVDETMFWPSGAALFGRTPTAAGADVRVIELT